MGDQIFAMVASHGLWVVAAFTFLSCLAVPVPSAVAMLAAGAFAAAGELSIAHVWAVALIAALAGDNLGFQIGRWGGPPLLRWLVRKTGRARLVARGRLIVRDYGSTGVFFSTFLFTALGPWVNVIAGAVGLPRWRFNLWDTLGETLWVTTYVVLGYTLGTQAEMIAELIRDWGMFFAALAFAALCAGALVLVWRARRRRSAEALCEPISEAVAADGAL